MLSFLDIHSLIMDGESIVRLLYPCYAILITVYARAGTSIALWSIRTALLLHIPQDELRVG